MFLSFSSHISQFYAIQRNYMQYLWSHMKWGCFAENMRKLQKIMCCINPHFTLVNYKSCQAYSLVSRCKKASFGTRSPLPAPLPTHRLRTRDSCAKKSDLCPKSAHKSLTHKKTIPRTAFCAHANTFEASGQPVGSG